MGRRKGEEEEERGVMGFFRVLGRRRRDDCFFIHWVGFREEEEEDFEQWVLGIYVGR